MKRVDARNSRIAYKYVMDNLMDYEGKNTNRLGEKSKEELERVWERAKEIWPAISSIYGCSPLGKDRKTIDLTRMREKYSRSVEYVAKWDALDCSITVQEYLEAIENLGDIKKRMMEESGLSISDLSLMGIL